MAKKSRIIRHRKYCYVCKTWITWVEDPDDENYKDQFFAGGHYDKQRLMEEGTRLAKEPPFKRFNFENSDLADYYIKGVSRDLEHRLMRARAIPTPHSASHR